MNVTRIGLDLAKNVFQIHGVDRDDSNSKFKTAISRRSLK